MNVLFPPSNLPTPRQGPKGGIHYPWALGLVTSTPPQELIAFIRKVLEDGVIDMAPNGHG